MTTGENIHRINRGDTEILLVGTAHVSRQSAELVEQLIDEERPEAVCVELCQSRYDALTQRDRWQQMDIVKVIREKRTSLLLSQLLMMSFQKRIAERFNINPGEEMLRAIAAAARTGVPVLPVDRELRVTLLRTWRCMGFWTKAKFLSEGLYSLFLTDEITEEEIEKLKQHDILEVALQTIGEKMPVLKEILIDERDRFIAHGIGHTGYGRIVVVVGAGHIPGILSNMDRDIDIEALNRIPEPGRWARLFGWGLSAAVIGLFVAGFFTSGAEGGLNMLKWWSLITASFAALGALALLAHPLTVLASALAAPFTTLHPLIAAGWVAGLTEVTLRKPQVKDLLDLPGDITTVRGFFSNKITRLLILVALVNLTTSVGTFVAIPVILRFL
ncbi:MAG: TraB/GumN family protein [Deltaproteobacteria bacterium]|nr:TraB/GumN family protein [Deltaproteobacteria bacterium]